MKFDEETRRALERPLEKAFEAVGLSWLSPARLEITPSEGVYLAVWGLRCGWGFTPEEALTNLYRNFRISLGEKAEGLKHEAGRLRLEALAAETAAAAAAAAAEEFPLTPPGLSSPET